MKKLISKLLVLAFILLLFPLTTVNAAIWSQEPINGGIARIYYAGNGKCLDTPAEALYDNGTQLQIWDEAEGNQNQLYGFFNTGDGWLIISIVNNKIIEVRDSSHDDYAQVAQWDRHNLACGRWDIIQNEDGTVSFRNKESGLYLNVYGGGNAQNGTRIIQYHDDGTIAMKFYLRFMEYNDVYSATFIRNIQEDEIEWSTSTSHFSIINQTKWFNNKNKFWYPTPNQGLILSTVEYLSPNTVANLMKEKAYNKSTWNEIKKAVSGETSETVVAALLTKLGFENVPGIGYALGILQTLLESKDREQWNKFLDAVKINGSEISGVIVYTYYQIGITDLYGPRTNGTTGWGWTHTIVKTTVTKYKTWSGSDFSFELPCDVKSGKWYISFK